MRFIGFYDYTVILTYLGLVSGVMGILCAAQGRFALAVTCLAIAGICDMFDGMVARTKKDRTTDEKNFGIQLDSLCDLVSFGVLPAMLLYFRGAKSPLAVALLVFYVLCAVIRLAFFNVLEARRQQTETGCARFYRGLPVTTSAIIVPLFFLLMPLLPEGVIAVGLYALPAVIGFLFILDFRVPKIDFAGLLFRQKTKN